MSSLAAAYLFIQYIRARMKLAFVCRLSTIIVLPAVFFGCGRATENFRPQCEQAAAISVYDKVLWSDFLLQNASERKAGGDWPKVFGTRDYILLSKEAETGSYHQRFGDIYQNDFIVRRSNSKKLVAVVKSLSLRTHGFAANRFWSCVYDWPSLYEPFITPAP